MSRGSTPAARGRAVWTSLLSATLVLALAGLVAAHAYVKESVPRDRQRLERVPEELVVVFTEPVETGVSRLRLVDAAGREVAGTRLRAVGDRELRLAVPPLPPGDYQLIWEILAKDGHVTTGAIPFTVTGEPAAEPAQPAEPAEPAPAPPPAAGTEQAPWAPAPWWPWLAGAGTLAVAAWLLGRWLRRWRS